MSVMSVSSMLIGLDKNNNRILAKEAIKGINYNCPACKKELIVRQGKINIWHYAHKYLGNCWWENESEDHLMTKMFLHDFFTKAGYTCDYEVVFPLTTVHSSSRTDLLIKKGQDQFAIEVIASPISPAEMLKRTYLLNKHLCPVLWILSDKLSQNIIDTEDEVRLTDYMFWLHGKIYFGRMYGVYKNSVRAIYPYYRTKKIVDRFTYSLIPNGQLVSFEKELGDFYFKFARFYDKYAKEKTQE